MILIVHVYFLDHHSDMDNTKLSRKNDKRNVIPSMFHRSSISAYEVHNFDEKYDGNNGDTEEFKEKEDFF